MVALAGDKLEGKPSPTPRLQVLSPIEIHHQPTYDGPTWLDQAAVAKWRPEPETPGFAAELRQALAARGQWLVQRNLAEASPTGDIVPKLEMMRTLRQAETERLVRDLSTQLNADYVAVEPGRQITGVYDRSVPTPSGNLAVIRRDDTFTLAPWKPALEPMKGRAVTGIVGPNRVTWTLDRGRGLPGR